MVVYASQWYVGSPAFEGIAVYAEPKIARQSDEEGIFPRPLCLLNAPYHRLGFAFKPLCL